MTLLPWILKDMCVYSHSNIRSPSRIKPIAAGPSLQVDSSRMKGSLLGPGALHMLRSSHWHTVRVKLSSVSHCPSWLSFTMTGTLYTPGEICCWACRSAEVAIKKIHINSERRYHLVLELLVCDNGDRLVLASWSQIAELGWLEQCWVVLEVWLGWSVYHQVSHPCLLSKARCNGSLV